MGKSLDAAAGADARRPVEVEAVARIWRPLDAEAGADVQGPVGGDEGASFRQHRVVEAGGWRASKTSAMRSLSLVSRLVAHSSMASP